MNFYCFNSGISSYPTVLLTAQLENINIVNIIIDVFKFIFFISIFVYLNFTVKVTVN